MARQALTLLAPGTTLFRKIVTLNFRKNSLLPEEQGIAESGSQRIGIGWNNFGPHAETSTFDMQIACIFDKYPVNRPL